MKDSMDPCNGVLCPDDIVGAADANPILGWKRGTGQTVLLVTGHDVGCQKLTLEFHNMAGNQWSAGTEICGEKIRTAEFMKSHYEQVGTATELPEQTQETEVTFKNIPGNFLLKF